MGGIGLTGALDNLKIGTTIDVTVFSIIGMLIVVIAVLLKTVGGGIEVELV